MKRCSRGFTLIELLVVIAIIAIMAAILFPVFTSAKATAKKSACISNMRQICSAWAMYVDNNDGSCPSLYNFSTRQTWMEELFPFIKNCAIFGCPASNIVPKSPSELDESCKGYLSYGWNGTLFNYADCFPVKDSDLSKASRTVFLADTVAANWLTLVSKVGPGTKDSDYRYTSMALSWNLEQQSLKDGRIMPKNPCHLSDRHNGMINVTFCDGHVASLNEMELTKTQLQNGKKVACLKRVSNSWVGAWTTGNPRSFYFPYFQVSASQEHY